MVASRHSTEQEFDFSTGLCIFFYIGREDHHPPSLLLTNLSTLVGKKILFSVVLAKAPELILIDPVCWAILEPVIMIRKLQRLVTHPIVEPVVGLSPIRMIRAGNGKGAISKGLPL